MIKNNKSDYIIVISKFFNSVDLRITASIIRNIYKGLSINLAYQENEGEYKYNTDYKTKYVPLIWRRGCL